MEPGPAGGKVPGARGVLEAPGATAGAALYHACSGDCCIGGTDVTGSEERAPARRAGHPGQM
ncbi:hypothetical protein GCM10010260_10250 [Streptomyces filipinensis]|uniref:Uncharacterized protein n=1 Tax=Streptomyces filipinensis TaxID=66887 RepID=A0A918I807_9ACTN|nr:hypothetical protein GCM10010260_10250 [Streptomyces filipinensis]